MHVPPSLATASAVVRRPMAPRAQAVEEAAGDGCSGSLWALHWRSGGRPQRSGEARALREATASASSQAEERLPSMSMAGGKTGSGLRY